VERDSWQGDILNFVFFVVIFGVLVFAIMRLGLVATVAALFFANNILGMPGAQGLTKFYEWAVVAGPAMLLLIVIWAFWRTSGQRLMSVSMEET